MISSPSNERIKWVRALQARKRERWEAGMFVLEGRRVAQEVVRAGAPVRMILHAADLSSQEQGIVMILLQ